MPAAPSLHSISRWAEDGSQPSPKDLSSALQQGYVSPNKPRVLDLLLTATPSDHPPLALTVYLFFKTTKRTVRQEVETCSVAQLCLTLCCPVDCSPSGSSIHGDSPGKNTRRGCHALLQRIFPTQGLNPGLLDCRQILHHCTTWEAPR